MPHPDHAQNEQAEPVSEKSRRSFGGGTRLMLCGGTLLGWILVRHVTTPGGHWPGLMSFGLLGAGCLLAGIVLAVMQRG